MKHIHANKVVAAVGLIVVLIGCTFVQAETTPPTATTMRVVMAQTDATPVPTISTDGRDLRAVATVTLETPPTNTPPPDATCQYSAAESITRHTVNADVDYAAHTVAVTHRLVYRNRANEPLDRIVLHIEPNRWAGTFALDQVTTANDHVAAYEATGRRLDVELSAPLEAGCALELDLAYTLTIPPVGRGVNALTGYFGYTARQLNLGHWLAAVAVRLGGEWVSHDVVLVGEQVVADAADWDITLRVANAPADLQAAAPGTLTRLDATTWRYTVENARDFAVSLSDAFNVIAQEASNGVMIEVYTFDDALITTATGTIDGAAHTLLVASRSLAMYSDLFGAYPYERFVIVEGDFSDGMEFSSLVFVGRDWFRTYTGDPAAYLTIITVHEVAHQWWYARVGSDQAITPWLDEALATYSEYIFFEEYYPALRNWWWNFRVGAFVDANYAGQRVDSSVYQFASIREYINAVYLRGATMLHDLRDDMGTDAFFDWLRRYAEAGAGRVVTPDVFWSLLSAEENDLTRETRAAYLSE